MESPFNVLLNKALLANSNIFSVVIRLSDWPGFLLGIDTKGLFWATP